MSDVLSGDAKTGIVCVVAALLLSTAGSAAATTGQGTADHADTQPPAFVVDLHEDGTATVTVTYTYDLSDADRQAAFEDLRNAESVRNDFRDRFEARMAAVASAAENETGREMSVSDATLTFETDGTTGIVAATVTWNGLAAVEDGRLTVTEPFASGFASGDPVHVIAPDGYEVTSVAPAPDERTDGHLTWAGGADLSGFELVAEAGETPGDGDAGTASAGDSGPGFGVLAAVGAVLAAGLLARRR